MFDVSYSYGWNRYQTAGPNFARARLGGFQRSLEGVLKSAGSRSDLAERWQGSPGRRRYLQFQITNCGPPFFPAPPGSGSRFLSTPHRAGIRVPEPAKPRSKIASRGVE